MVVIWEVLCVVVWNGGSYTCLVEAIEESLSRNESDRVYADGKGK